MKRFFAIAVVLMLILMSLGCATVPEYTAGSPQDLSSTVGNKQFVGGSSRDAVDLAYSMSGHQSPGGR
jgi:hypothetical protein